ncbi:hypothetical protein L1887_55803 [Cichorium endivia]|nr:hypothetical protein L1887_55803 [Cichorium endivia]
MFYQPLAGDSLARSVPSVHVGLFLDLAQPLAFALSLLVGHGALRVRFRDDFLAHTLRVELERIRLARILAPGPLACSYPPPRPPPRLVPTLCPTPPPPPGTPPNIELARERMLSPSSLSPANLLSDRIGPSRDEAVLEQVVHADAQQRDAHGPSH